MLFLKDVIFEGVKIRVNTDFSNIKYMIIAPLAIKAENVTVQKVFVFLMLCPKPLV